MALHRSIRRHGARGFFASANSAEGFYSLFGEAYSEEKYKSLYILKGGPGTGKSTLLDSIAARAEREGVEHEVVLCSSDPESLDGVVIDALGVAIFDGTSPHSRDPLYPGVCGEVINLGEMWNADKLHRRRDEVESLFKTKSESYARAYRLLGAAGIAGRDVIHAYGRASDDEKMNAAVKRLYRQLFGRSDGGGRISRRFITAHSVKGKVTLDTVDKLADVTVTVSRSHGFGFLYMRALHETAAAHGVEVLAVPDALLPEYYEALYFPNEGILARTADDETYENGDIRINCGRFIKNDVLRGERAKLRFSEKICTNLTDEALASLAEAGRTHEKIEDIYKSAMDFDSVSAVEKRLEVKIFG